MAGNPWHRYGASPWVLMVGSGEVGDFKEDYEGYGAKSGRSVHISFRPWSVAYLKLMLDHVTKLRPRLIRDPKTVRDKYDYYFDSATDNRVRVFQATHHLKPDGMVGKGTMGAFWDIGRGDSFVREHERKIRHLMLQHIRLNLSSYKRVR